MAVAACGGLGWENALGDWWAKAAIVALFSASITLLSASSNEARHRLLTSLLGPAVAWGALTLVATVMALVKFGSFEEGGPVGLTLALGFYLGLPIAILTWILTLLTWRRLGPRLTRVLND